MTKNYEKLKKIICEANPSILELKFGCEFEYYNHDILEKHTMLWEDEGEIIHTGKDSDYRSWTEIEELKRLGFKILGRKIMLDDVVEVVEKLNFPLYDETIRGLFYSGKKDTRWKPNQSLDNQTPEAISFLLDLLS